MLMIGLDTRDDNPGIGSRADSIIIVHIPASARPRLPGLDPARHQRDDPGVPEDRLRRRHRQDQRRVRVRQPERRRHRRRRPAARDDDQEACGHHLQRGASIVNFDGFKTSSTALGGVNMCVDEKTTSLHHGFITGTDEARRAVQDHRRRPALAPDPGHARRWSTSSDASTSTPYEALDYVRQPRLPAGDGDYDRQRHQQQFIKALLKEAYRQGPDEPAHAQHVPGVGQQGVRLRRRRHVADPTGSSR